MGMGPGKPSVIGSPDEARSPDGAKRNPGLMHAARPPRISLRFIRATGPRYASALSAIPTAHSAKA
ncbi:hypothetical protein ACVIGB_006760 [Bradyrhizobium sp. USDA 4341]